MTFTKRAAVVLGSAAVLAGLSVLLPNARWGAASGSIFSLVHSITVPSWLQTVELFAAALLAFAIARDTRDATARWAEYAGSLALLALSFAEVTRLHFRLEMWGESPVERVSGVVVLWVLLIVAGYWHFGHARDSASGRPDAVCWVTCWTFAVPLNLYPDLPMAARVAGSLLYIAGGAFLALSLAQVMTLHRVEWRTVDLGIRIALGVVALLAVLHVFARDVHPGDVYWFNLDTERNLPTWVKAVLFASAGFAALIAWWRETAVNRRRGNSFDMPFLWGWLGGLFLLFSLDEVARLHQNIVGRVARGETAHSGGNWRYMIQWQLILAPAGLAAACCLVAFFVTRYAGSRRALAYALCGLGVWFASQVLESVHPRFRAAGPGWYALEVVLEDSFKSLGSILIVLSVRHYLSAVVERVREGALAGARRLSLWSREVAVAVLALVASFGIAAYTAYRCQIHAIVSPGQGTRRN